LIHCAVLPYGVIIIQEDCQNTYASIWS